MTMIERVGQAIQNEPSLRGVIPTGWRNMVDWDAVARAVIQAMREPTDEMQDAGYHGTPYWVTAYPEAVWQAMIDAALEEK